MIKTFLHWLHRVEDAVLILLLAAMIGLSASQIILRNLFDTGLIWADPLLRVLVLWTGLLGATVASRDNKHIRIDLFSRFFSRRVHEAIQFVVGLFTAAVCAVIAWYAARWVQLDYQDSLTAFSGLPAWVLELIIPLAFALIALRYLLHSLVWLKLCCTTANSSLEQQSPSATKQSEHQ